MHKVIYQEVLLKFAELVMSNLNCMVYGFPIGELLTSLSLFFARTIARPPRTKILIDQWLANYINILYKLKPLNPDMVKPTNIIKKRTGKRLVK